MAKNPITSDIVKTIAGSDQKNIKVAITDIDGVLRGKYLHKDKFLSAVKKKGFGFCGVVLGWDCMDSCYEKNEFTGWHSGYPDAMVNLDINSLRQIPWENKQFFVLGEFVDSKKEPLAICPRSLLKRITGQADGLGYFPQIGFEFEWFNFLESPHSLQEKKFKELKPLTPGMFGYSILRSSQNSGYFRDLLEMMRDFSIPLEGLHTETGPGVYEAAIVRAAPVEAADRGVLFKTGVKEIAYRHGILATFMSRWSHDYPGCSGHTHISLWDADGSTNLFFDDRSADGMSEIFCHFLGGLLKALPDLLPVFAPTVNSYKRLVEGFWAPTSATWGFDNRTTAIRVINHDASATRLELRVAGSDINPYLVGAAAVGAGLWGIKHQISLKEKPISGSAYDQKHGTSFSKNLHEAAIKMGRSEAAHEILGEAFVKHFVNSRLWEWQQFASAVTDWELNRYFEII